jgi:hypothetical protein
MLHTDRKRNFPSLFCIPHKFSMPALCDAADVKPIIHFRPFSEGADQTARFAIHRHPSRWNFSYHCFVLFFTGGSFPNLVRKRRCTITIDCVRVYSSTQNAFSARVAIFTQPALLAAIDVTKHPRHVQRNMESFSFYRCVACYHSLRHSSVPIFCNVSGNYEYACRYLRWELNEMEFMEQIQSYWILNVRYFTCSYHYAENR